jgi:hypothetical protein
MTDLVVRPGPVDDASSAPMAQILWLHRGTPVDGRPPSPVPLRKTPPRGWYGDRLRFFDGRGWTDEVRPIHRPSSVMRVAYEEEPTGPSDPPADPRAEIVVPTGVGLLGLPPPLAPVSVPASPGVAPEPEPSEVGLIAGVPRPWPVSAPVRRPARCAGDVRHGLLAGLRTSRFVLAWAAVAVAAVVAIGFLSSH